MTNRSCPICNTKSSLAKLFLKQNIDPMRLSAFSFASRKLPEFMCHELVRCPTCDLVYASTPPNRAALANAYHISEFDSAQEADDAAVAYEKAIQPVLRQLKSKCSAMEIGAGTGAFLEILKNQGFRTVVGVEPSSAAIAAAPIHRQLWIRDTIFHEEDFPPKSLDLICCFMTLEHVSDPHEIVSAASRLLKPGGAIALVTHNYRGVINRILGKHSPIIDIEHMQLFSPSSIRKLLENTGFESIKISSFKNRYAIRYWIRLLPLGPGFKQKMIKVLDVIRLSDIKLSLNVGNIVSFGYRQQD